MYIDGKIFSYLIQRQQEGITPPHLGHEYIAAQRMNADICIIDGMRLRPEVEMNSRRGEWLFCP